jgi:hypothetical protein
VHWLTAWEYFSKFAILTDSALAVSGVLLQQDRPMQKPKRATVNILGKKESLRVIQSNDLLPEKGEKCWVFDRSPSEQHYDCQAHF